MNEGRGALGAYVQKLGEYDLLCSDDDEKEPALRAELLSTVLKSGTVSSRGAWGDKDWSQPQWLVLAPSRCDGEGGVAADPFLAALREFPGDDCSSFDELEVWRVSLAPLGAVHRSESEPRVLGLECADGARVFVEYIFSFAFRASLFLARCPIGLNEIKVSLLTIIHNSQKLYLIAFVFSTETRNLLHRTRWEKD